MGTGSSEPPAWTKTVSSRKFAIPVLLVQQLSHSTVSAVPFITWFATASVTGWAQLCYPYGASKDDAKQKLQFDLYYVKNHSLFLDFMICLTTVEVVLFGKGAR